MLKTFAALGLTAALVLSPMAAFAQSTDTTAPAADAKPMAEKPMKAKPMKKKAMKKKMKMEKMDAAPAADAPK